MSKDNLHPAPTFNNIPSSTSMRSNSALEKLNSSNIMNTWEGTGVAPHRKNLLALTSAAMAKTRTDSRTGVDFIVRSQNSQIEASQLLSQTAQPMNLSQTQLSIQGKIQSAPQEKVSVPNRPLTSGGGNLRSKNAN